MGPGHGILSGYRTVTPAGAVYLPDRTALAGERVELTDSQCFTSAVPRRGTTGAPPQSRPVPSVRPPPPPEAPDRGPPRSAGAQLAPNAG